MTLSKFGRYDGNRVDESGGKAVVLGAGIAGLCVARVVADAFDQVILVERDSLPENAVKRGGVPQSAHPHVLWEAGRATLEDFFPGYGEELVSAGGLFIDVTTDFNYYIEEGFVADGRSSLPMYAASRPLFEHLVRRRVVARDDVEVWSNCQFVEYLLSDDATAVTGVVVEDECGQTTLSAALVADATGRTSQTPTWLENHGYPSPPAEEIRVDVSYNTVAIERPPTDRRLFVVSPSPSRTSYGGLFPVEDGRWLAILGEMHSDGPPPNAETITSIAENLPIPHVERLLTTQPWIDREVRSYFFPSNVRWRYEDIDSFPDNLVVVGDAIASFNPIYAQGMSVAALEALLLHHLLADGIPDDIGLRFFEQVTAVVDIAWQLAVDSDHRFPQTSGPSPRGSGFRNRYRSRVIRSAHSDPTVADAFYRVLAMQHSPTLLLRPGILWRVLT
ncbi:NAD(P)/FAD-dependent oxidoreductase [Natrinema ejinorense]|uniref:Oxidoreductase n=1 Tax=Natrinema ejinorense TaxID=373386 RepID=A0A2A5QRW8_9EURY|nr:FAD-dependent monooxygenase [Natrinema ejinorense]PCR89586.1 oxidoreductase [Natrinema ejinorense]